MGVSDHTEGRTRPKVISNFQSLSRALSQRSGSAHQTAGRNPRSGLDKTEGSLIFSLCNSILAAPLRPGWLAGWRAGELAGGLAGWID